MTDFTAKKLATIAIQRFEDDHKDTLSCVETIPDVELLRELLAVEQLDLVLIDHGDACLDGHFDAMTRSQFKFFRVVARPTYRHDLAEKHADERADAEIAGAIAYLRRVAGCDRGFVPIEPNAYARFERAANRAGYKIGGIKAEGDKDYFYSHLTRLFSIGPTAGVAAPAVAE